MSPSVWRVSPGPLGGPSWERGPYASPQGVVGRLASRTNAYTGSSLAALSVQSQAGLPRSVVVVALEQARTLAASGSRFRTSGSVIDRRLLFESRLVIAFLDPPQPQQRA
jgi:hypothetical protein